MIRIIRHPASTNARRDRYRQCGVTLVEMLIALLVISIGLLGLAGLQNVSLQYNYSSYQRTNANNMAYDIADRMRANREAALGGRYNIDFGDTPTVGGIAGDDLSQWLNAVQATLPDGQASVEVRNNGRARIRVRWLDDRTDDDADDQTTTYTLRTRL